MVSQPSLFPLNELALESTPIQSPLRYPGGKLWLATYIERSLELNRLHPALFVEPFAGGASIALTLLAKGKVERIGLMDRDPLVAAFWVTLFRDTDWLVEQVSTVEVTLEQWHRFRATAPSGRRDRALRGLFFNRTNYSGIINRRAGPIGGQKQESAYKIDCRFPRATLIERIQQVASLKDRVAFVWNCSWRAGIARLTHQCRRGEFGVQERDIFYYLDPPFFDKAERLYTYFFTARDHWRLRATVDRLGSPWILSYDAGEKVDTFYGCGQRTPEIQLQYTTARAAASRQIKTEAIIAQADMILPQDIDMRYKETRKAALLWKVTALPPDAAGRHRR